MATETLWEKANAKRAEAGDLAAKATAANLEADALEEKARAKEGSSSEAQAAADADAVANAADRTDEAPAEAEETEE